MFRVALKDAHMYKVPRLHSTFCPSVSVHHALVFPYVLLVFLSAAFQRVAYFTLPYLILPCALHFQGGFPATHRRAEMNDCLIEKYD